jgi:hypothetical protein
MLDHNPILVFWSAPDEALFAPETIAKVRHVSTSLLDRERWLGTGPQYRKIRGRVLYRKGDVLAWMDEVAEQPEGTRPKADTRAEVMASQQKVTP